MLNSAEHEILNVHKYKIIKKFSFFTGLDSMFYKRIILTHKNWKLSSVQVFWARLAYNDIFHAHKC